MNVGLKYPGAQRFLIVKFKNTGTIDARWNTDAFANNVTHTFCTINATTGANISCEDRTRMMGFFPLGVEDSNGVYADTYLFGDEGFMIIC